MANSTRRLRLGLVLVLLLSCGLAVVLSWGPLQERMENARLRSELLHQQKRARLLRGAVDTLQARTQRPAPAPAPPTISL